MGPRCEHCPVEEAAWCIGLCEWAASGDPARRAHIVRRSESGPTGERTEHPAPAIPLAGDLMATASRLIGADRLARWVAENMGYDDCGCADRQRWLNEQDAKLRRYLGLTAPPGDPVEPPQKAD
jgi:hypothetical protein